MKINILAGLILFVASLFPELVAQESEYYQVEDINFLENKLTEHAKATFSIESDFVQEKHLWMLDEVLISKGEFLFKKENDVSWQYITPVKYRIVIHNGIFTIVNNNKVNEFSIDSNPLFREINNMIVTAIRGDFIGNPDFEAMFLEDSISYLAILSPTNENVSSMLEKIEIYFNRENMQVSKVIFREPGDDFTLITFINKTLNSEISDDRFLIDAK